jgi:ribosomal 50S subunit-associated protein YjgA (DUF615 family)
LNIHEEEQVPISKTRRKRAMEELQTLGEELVALSSDRVRNIDLPEDLRVAVGDAQRMTRHDEARRRQMQFIGKLMRNVDVESVRGALALVRGESASAAAKLHRIERLRTSLLADEKVSYEIALHFPSVICSDCALCAGQHSRAGAGQTTAKLPRDIPLLKGWNETGPDDRGCRAETRR